MLKRLEETWRHCANCKELAAKRTNVVHWRGNPGARLAVLGEAPGADEDEQGKPFVGRSGRLLDALLKKAGLDPAEDVFIANMVACRPPNNRKPTSTELAACSIRLQYLLGHAVRPRALLLLGTVPAKLAGIQGNIGRHRGEEQLVEMLDYSRKIHRWPAVVTFHPAYLLRVNNAPTAANVVSDIRLAFSLTKKRYRVG